MEYILGSNKIVKDYNLNPSDKDKYLLIAIARDENVYIEEWVNHYLNLGFDKIIIGDNNDDDSLSVILKDYIERGQVEIYDCKGLKCFQVDFYNVFANKGWYKWAAYFDCDEFLELTTEYTTIQELTNEIGVDNLRINWMAMSNGGAVYQTDGSVQERFPYMVPMNASYCENHFFKTMLRGGISHTFFGPHSAKRFDGEKENVNYGGYYITDNVDVGSASPIGIFWKECYLKHYRVKSLYEFNSKFSRGDSYYGTFFNTLSSLYNLYAEKPHMHSPLFIRHYPKANGNLVINHNKDVHWVVFIERLKNILYNNNGVIIILISDDIDNNNFNYIYELCNAANCKLYRIDTPLSFNKICNKLKLHPMSFFNINEE